MKILSKTLILILTILLFQSCGVGEWDISELYGLKIEGTSKIIYKYDAWGGRDSNANGYIILDSAETFKVDIPKELPFYYLKDIPNKNSITGVSHKCDNSCGQDYSKSNPIYEPIEFEELKKEDIKIEHYTYQYRGFAERGGGLGRFHFESFKEKRDSIFFYDLDDIESLNGKHLDSLKLKKKMVFIQENKNSEIIKLVLKDLTINKENNEIMSNRTYFLTPKNTTRVESFSDYGIFKPIKIK
ncbi:hypothetical protein [Aquimarina sp. SS2-1]|uniref:hypothetical protein n=1 Tax=Aquimarina besae TaxID=3342247 RepID=UPI0036711E3C